MHLDVPDHVLAERRAAMEAKGDKAWKPAARDAQSLDGAQGLCLDDDQRREGGGAGGAVVTANPSPLAGEGAERSEADEGAHRSLTSFATRRSSRD